MACTVCITEHSDSMLSPRIRHDPRCERRYAAITAVASNIRSCPRYVNPAVLREDTKHDALRAVLLEYPYVLAHNPQLRRRIQEVARARSDHRLNKAIQLFVACIEFNVRAHHNWDVWDRSADGSEEPETRRRPSAQAKIAAKLESVGATARGTERSRTINSMNLGCGTYHACSSGDSLTLVMIRPSRRRFRVLVSASSSTRLLRSDLMSTEEGSGDGNLVASGRSEHFICNAF